MNAKKVLKPTVSSQVWEYLRQHPKGMVFTTGEVATALKLDRAAVTAAMKAAKATGAVRVVGKVGKFDQYRVVNIRYWRIVKERTNGKGGHARPVQGVLFTDELKPVPPKVQEAIDDMADDMAKARTRADNTFFGYTLEGVKNVVEQWDTDKLDVLGRTLARIAIKKALSLEAVDTSELLAELQRRTGG